MNIKEKLIAYLKDKGVAISEAKLKYLDNGVKISENDEYMHNWDTFPDHHNESWYFNFIDQPNKIYFITRVSFVMDRNLSQIMMILIIDGKNYTYYKEIPLEKMPDNWEFDKKIKFYCIKPFDEWRIKYEDRKISLDVNLKGRFPVHNSLEDEDPIEVLEKYGVEVLEIAGQQHYEQPTIATGTLVLKKTGETRNINCFGQRDHSWGSRDWVNINGWNWAAAQFEDETINLWHSIVFNKSLESGTVFTKNKNIRIMNVDVTTQFANDMKKPISSKFTFTDEYGNKRELVSETIFSLHFPVPTSDSMGFSEIYEQIAKFKCDDKEGFGISEYMISTHK
ncbi:MAG: DUF7064 domain-containing protein [Candidatus Helarchaeota archaeon]